jgi:hypothetical protein
MTQEDIEQWTREAGCFDATPEFLERFATLVWKDGFNRGFKSGHDWADKMRETKGEEMSDKQKPPTLEDLMAQGVTRMLNGREVVLGSYGGHHDRIGFVYKDTGLPPTQAEIDTKKKKKK